ncbi:TIGR03619 family F420-dependent LLM class oxidoreductase [Blastococcus sp. SYSU D00813]
MRFSTGLPGLDRYPPSRYPPGAEPWQARLTAADFQRIARTADDLGFDAISVSEHLVVPTSLAPAMGAHWPHASTAMAFLAGATTRIRVNSAVIVLPYHHPVALAKAVATLDVLSGGRVTLTFGVGMAPGEFAALGVPFERRGAVMDEYVAVLKELWTAERPSFDGEWVRFSDVVFEPRPVQTPHPPLWFGGRSLVSLRRAAREGDGWAPAGGLLGKGPWLEEPEQLPAMLDSVAHLRDGRPLDVDYAMVQPRIGPDHTVQPPAFRPTSAQQIVDEAGRLASLGVTWTSVPSLADVPDTLEGHLEGLHWTAENVLAAFR